MPRGVVLPFPPHGLTQADCEGLTRFAAGCAGIEVEIFPARGRRMKVATITAMGQQFWIEREAAVIRVREAWGGHPLAEGTVISTVLAQVQTALLPGGLATWGRRTGSLG
jgi:hypothetical protein